MRNAGDNNSRERIVIAEFCKRMAVLTRKDCVVESRPDEEFPGEGKCDAIVRRGKIRWAFDHTRLNSYRDQAKDEHLYKAIVSSLQKSLLAICDKQHVTIALPFKVFHRGKHAVLKARFERLLREAIPKAKDDGEFHQIELSDPKCTLHISRRDSDLPGCFIRPIAPPNHQNELQKDFKRAILAKGDQLSRNRPRRGRTAMLLDTSDLSLINESRLVEAFQRAASSTDHSEIDEIFVFDHPTGIGNHFVWPLKYRGVMPPNLKWMNEFWRAQTALVWGFTDRGPPYIRSKLLNCSERNNG